MGSKRQNQILFWITVLILTLCIIIIGMFCGYSHAPGKLKIILITLTLVLLFHYLIGDPIKFVLYAIEDSFWLPQSRKFNLNDEAKHHNRLDYLKLRLEGLRSLLYITEQHRNEKLNVTYRQVLTDLWLYGKYYFFLVCLILLTRDEHKFYASRNVKQLFLNNDTMYFGLSEIHYLSDVYKFFESSLNNTLNLDENRVPTVLLGDVRLRQLRLTKQNYGLSDPPFTTVKYMPKWELPYEELPYKSKYWRVFEPWIPIKSADQYQNLLMNLKHNGYYRNYPGQQGYVAILTHSRQNSLTILKYLDDYKWLNYNTSVLFIDFSLYNLDANMLSVCSLRLEQTPFGSIIPFMEVESMKFVQNLSYVSTCILVVLFLYILSYIQFYKALLVKLWYNPQELRETWNLVDIGIFIVNVMLLALIINRDTVVISILNKMEESSKTHFIELRYASRLQMVFDMMMGFLIAITTMRLWKVLQFSQATQLFTHTLFLGWRAVTGIIMAICIFIMALAVAFSVMYGNNSFNFYRLSRSIVSCVCFSLGFSKGFASDDFNSSLGLIFYGFLVLFFSVLLLNISVSVMNDNYTTAKVQRDFNAVHHISFFEFLRIECSIYFKFLQKFRLFRRAYQICNQIVSENIKRDIDCIEKYRRCKQTQNTYILKKGITLFDIKRETEEFRRHQECVHTIGDIVNTQIDILTRMLYSNKDRNLKDMQKLFES